MANVLSELVGAAAEQYPSKCAYRCLSKAVSYSQLASRTAQVARFLASEGVERGDRVGVWLPRCLESAIAVHGILRAGAAFVPIDPATPPSRFLSIVNDCGIRHLITDRAKQTMLTDLRTADTTHLQCVLGAELPPSAKTRSYRWDDLDSLPTQWPASGVADTDLAYVMYTSGSTGIPKGIMHTHGSGCAYAELSRDLYRVRPTDVIGNHSPLHFDMSTFGYLTGPLSCATTSIIPAAYTKLPASLSQLIEDHAISIWYSVPFALIHLLLRGACEKRDHRALRWILFGGEPFPPKHLQAAMRHWPQAQFSNVYGPAEVNQCTYFHLPQAWRHRSEFPQIPIGKTWDRTHALVIGTDGTSPAQEGELLIASPTMMKGYWGRPDLDDAAFYHRGDNSAEHESRTYYRTGDLVRIQPDGEMLFLGRKDRQIKLRGHRIELDEIESTLSSYHAVEEVGAYPITRDAEVCGIGVAVLLSRTDEQWNAGSATAKIATFAASHLPAYAVPSRINVVESMPRTTSGKIDRRLLQIRDEKKLCDAVSPDEA